MCSLLKKIFCLTLAAGLSLSCFAACGKEETADSKDDASKVEQSKAEENNSEESSVISENESIDADTTEESSASEDSEARPHRPDRPDRPNRPQNGGNRLPEDSDIKADPIDSYFDNSVFIGYSIMMHFGRYIGEWRTEVDPGMLGTAQFCAGVSVGFTVDRIQTPDMPDTSLPLYQGQAYNFADLPAATGCDTLYIGLSGYSDLKRAMASETCVISAYNEAVMGIERIKAKNPDLKIVILSCTYNTEIFEGLTRERCTNAQVLEYNNLVLDYCTQNGIDFIDVSTVLTDKNGLLNEDLSNDGEYHLLKNTYFYWLEALRDYAEQKQAGTWQNMEDMPTLPAF
ncbi:MAG: hypothetical protein E7597_02875 [Ruminococcaceae bacterium]|nr:hypothetical protein [Oscillospiraceae bacterium]